MSGVEKSAVYRIGADASVETIWSSRDENVFDLALSGDDLLIVSDTGGVTVIDPSTPLKRLNYFDGKFLRADDFNLEQGYLRNLVALSNQGLGAGVVYGYDTTLAAGDSIQVGPGPLVQQLAQLLGRPVTDDDVTAQVEFWTQAGYALVTVDGRGTGASSGQWVIPWSDQEIADLGQVVDIEVGIFLGGRKTDMPQQFLDNAEIGTHFQEVGGE